MTNQRSASAEATAHVALTLQDGYRFAVDYGSGLPLATMDEAPPLGGGEGPDALAALGAAIGHCLSASLLYCLRRARVAVGGLRTDVELTTTRNAAGRLRVGKVHVRLRPSVPPEGEAGLRRCLGLFEDFCTVTASVREGIDVEVTVTPPEEAAEGAAAEEA